MTGHILQTRRIEDSDIYQRLPLPRPVSAHKRSFGRLQIVAGSTAYPGAARLCALGAFKAGCGYICLESEAPLDIIRDLPEIIPAFHAESDAFVMGPGLDWPLEKLVRILEKIPSDKPLLLDGGALQFFRSFNCSDRQHLVLTPHEGEMAKLLGNTWSADQIRQDRVAAMTAFTAKFPHATLVLKGSPTLISAKNCIWVMDRGSVAMATAGQGDVLAGVIGAYLALGMSTENSAILGTSLCAMAATELSAGGEAQGVLAHEVAERLPAVIVKLRSCHPF